LPVTDAKKKGFDGQTNLFNYRPSPRGDPLPLVSGIDARLIEAEAKLSANDIAGTMTILNAPACRRADDRHLQDDRTHSAPDACDFRTRR